MNFLEIINKKSLIGAHRGARALRPENTLSSLEMSLGRCDFAEVDVQFSADGVAIIMHDATLKRTTNVRELAKFSARAPYRVCDFRYEELLELDYGSWFYKSDPFHQIAEGVVNPRDIADTKEPLLTLKETLKFVHENQLCINIEIKDVHTHLSDAEVVTAITKEIEFWHVAPLVVLSSFRHAYLPLCKKMMPSVATAALIEHKLPHAKTLQVECLHLSDALVTPALVSQLHGAGYFVNVYTVNDPARKKELIAMGVNGIITDFV